MKRFPWRLAMVFAIVALAVLAAGGWFYHAQRQHLYRTTESGLQAVARLKIDEIGHWRSERLGDAAVLMENPFFTEAVARWAANPQPVNAEGLLRLFRSLRAHYHYEDVLFVDAAGRARLSLGNRTDPLCAEITSALAAAYRRRQAVLSDLHAESEHAWPHLSVIAPLFLTNAPSVAPLGAVILQCEARQFLYPLLQNWPTSSQSAETLLVRREGDAVLFLNDLRHQADTALKLRIPLTQDEVPAVQAVKGGAGIVQGRDYRGIQVLAVISAIPDSPWFLVAKLDVAEAFAAWRSRSVLILALIGGFLVTAGGLAGLVWQRTEKAHYRALLQAETNRRQSEERYYVLFEQAAVGVAEIDSKTGRFLRINRRYGGITGYPAEETLRSTYPMIAHPVDLPANSARMESMLAGRIREFALEQRFLRKDGAVIWVNLTVAPLWAPGAEPTSHVVVVEDITQRKAHEAEIARFNRLYATLSQVNQTIARCQSREALFADICRVMVECCQFTAAWIAWKRSENEPPAAVAHWASGPDSNRNMPGWQGACGVMAEAIRTGRACLCDAQTDARTDCCRAVLAGLGVRSCAAFPLRVRGEIWGGLSLCSIDPAFFNPAEIQLLDKVASDINYALDKLDKEEQHLRDVAALRENEDFTRAVLDNLPVGIAVNSVDPGVAFRYMNDNFVRFYRTTREKLTAPDVFWNVVYEDLEFRQAIKQRVIEDCASGDPARMCWPDVPITRQGERTGFITARNIPLPQNKLMISTVWDVTERMQAEAAVRQLNEELDQRVRERTAELEAANKELEAFSYSVSHDLRAPLRAIDGFALILSEDYAARLDAEGQRILGTVCAEARRMGQLIDDLLAFSRMHRQSMERTVINMGAMAQAAFERWAAQTPERDLRFQAEPMPAAQADPAMLRQVLDNLISNAVKYTRGRERAEIEIGGRNENGYNLYYVKDNGAGFDMKYVHKLFGVFQRLHTEAEFEGTGVGLALVQRIVHRHGGRVWAEGRLNEGATFYFTLPAPEKPT